MISLLFRGLVLGFLYALASIGLSLQWGVLRNLNFAHGACITLGAYVLWSVMDIAGIPYLPAFLIMLIIMFVIGMGIEWLTVRPFFAKNDTNTFIATVALSTMLSQLCLILFGGREKVVASLLNGTFEFGPIRASYHELFSMVVTVIALLVLWVVLQKTKTGMSIRAVSQDQTGAILAGINTRMVYGVTMGVATILAGIAGALLGPIYYATPTMGDNPMTKAFIIVIFGGLGSLRGTVVAAFIIAFVEVLVSRYIATTWAPITLFILMVVILVCKPEGLFGVSQRKA